VSNSLNDKEEDRSAVTNAGQNKEQTIDPVVPGNLGQPTASF